MNRKSYEWVDGRRVIVGATDFPFESLDTFEDHVREIVRRGLPIEPALETWIMDRAFALRAEGMRLTLDYVIDSARPQLACYQLAAAAGMYVANGTPGEELGRRFGITRQAFWQGVARYRVKLRSPSPQALQENYYGAGTSR